MLFSQRPLTHTSGVWRHSSISETQKLLAHYTIGFRLSLQQKPGPDDLQLFEAGYDGFAVVVAEVKLLDRRGQSD